MHHLKETTIDGVKFVLIPEELHDALAGYVENAYKEYFEDEARNLMEMWTEYDPEIFNAL